MREFALIKGLMFLGLGSTWLWSPLQLNKRCNACHSRCIALCRAHVLLCRRFEAHSHRLHAVSQRPDQIGIVRYPILLLKLARYARKLCLLLRAPAPAPSLLTLKLPLFPSAGQTGSWGEGRTPVHGAGGAPRQAQVSTAVDPTAGMHSCRQGHSCRSCPQEPSANNLHLGLPGGAAGAMDVSYVRGVCVVITSGGRFGL